jgi:hypothetical protein
MLLQPYNTSGFFSAYVTSYVRIERINMGNIFVKIQEATNTQSKRESIFIFILVLVLVILYIYYRTKDTTPVLPSGYNISADKQRSMIDAAYSSNSSGKRAIVNDTQQLDKMKFTCLNNFYALGCRYTGYIGPIEDGYFDPITSVQMAVNAGCRVFVLDIDYIDKQCDTGVYVPRIVVRDAKGRMMIQYNNNYQINNPTGEIQQVCDAIQTYAFGPGCQNRDDPVIIVLYFLRTPPGDTRSNTVLKYYSAVAKAMTPFKNRLLSNEPSGVFHRQQQEGLLLSNSIKNYQGKVLIFSNANTSGFRNTTMPFTSEENLDFLVNLRLSYTQTKMGSTENDNNTFGILQSADDYMAIPLTRKSEIIAQTRKKWTICLSPNPSLPVSKDTYHYITKTYGVQCVPANLFDVEASAFLFTDELFKVNGFKPKPCEKCTDANSDDCLCIVPPVSVAAGPANKQALDANGGGLRMPSMPSL